MDVRLFYFDEAKYISAKQVADYLDAKRLSISRHCQSITEI